jgi:hypothetical protein
MGRIYRKPLVSSLSFYPISQLIDYLDEQSELNCLGEHADLATS